MTGYSLSETPKPEVRASIKSCLFLNAHTTRHSTFGRIGSHTRMECVGHQWAECLVHIISSQGACPEPGGVPLSTRTSYNGPYNPGSQVTYNCYDGTSATITCQRNGTWTQKPHCSGQLCGFVLLITLIKNSTQHQIMKYGAFVRCIPNYIKCCNSTGFSQWKISSIELAVIWGNFSCSDLACSDLACSDLACSDLGHFFVKILTFSLNIHNLGAHLAPIQMAQIWPNRTFTHCFTTISTYQPKELPSIHF